MHVDCTTNNPLTPKSSVSKSVTVNGVSGDGTAVKPGDVLAWTITVKNAGSVTIPSGQLFSDDVSQAIAGTNLGNALASFTSSSGQVALAYNTTTMCSTGSAVKSGGWCVGDGHVWRTVAAQSVLNGPPAITTIDNTVVPSGSTTCDVDCTTHNPLTPKSSVSKSVTVNGVSGDGTAVKPGDVLAWTITVKNIGSVMIPSGQLFTDDVSQAIAGTNLGNALGSFTSSSGQVALAYNTTTHVLTGSADGLAAGATVTVRMAGRWRRSRC